ncbi:MAG: diguanylate cyclase [Amphritea sp.]|nr:diguanylate cyclase [Amphritea sp.]
MNEIDSLQLQLERQVLVLHHNIQNIYDALELLSATTGMLFSSVPQDSRIIQDWLIQEAFQHDERGYITNQRSRSIQKGDAPGDNEIAYFCPELSDLENTLGKRLYALRGIGSVLKPIRDSLSGATYIYYQDIEYNASIAYPFFDISEIIPADFNWLEYVSVNSVSPENNPQKAIQWAPPNIDYAGEGLITIISIPVYEQGKQIGVWSIDMPLRNIHQNCVLDTVVPGQTSFIADFNGNLVTHPSISTQIDKEKGSFYQPPLTQLGGDFQTLNLQQIITDKKGTLRLEDARGKSHIALYQTLPEAHWVLFATLPEERLFETIRKKIAHAFDGMRGNELPHIIDFEVSDEMQTLIDSYNDMVKIVAYNQHRREKAQQEALESQRILTEELEHKVKQRTLELQQANDKLAQLANTDSLTGICNRRHFFELAAPLIRLLNRDKQVACVLMLDIDRFKLINDTHGHDTGDQFLVAVTRVISSTLRKSDLVARFGGEEFAIFLHKTELYNAAIVAEKIRSEVADQIRINNTGCTVSIGVAELRNSDINQAIRHSDEALYAAKNNGRNQIACYNKTMR